jgi:DedD protein
MAQTEESARFIVQVGAFSDAGAVRNLRARIERLGLTTYTQAVDTAGGRRIRVRLGPFDSREAAIRALEKLQQSGVTGGIVLSL